MGRQSAAYFHLGLENTEGETETLKVTGEHPLFSPAKGWVQANSLVAGDTLITRDGTEVTVTANTLDLTPSLVYNLEVADAHTYFVGDFDVWSHNGRKFRGKARDEVMAKNGGKCVRCGDPAKHADHIWPWVLGGETIVENGQPLCVSCNCSKGGKKPIKGLDLDWPEPE